MSRSGYSDELDSGQLNCWRGAVQRAIEGRRGQALLRDMLNALDALPSKRLIVGDLIDKNGECCALGAVALSRNLDVSQIDEGDRDQVGSAFDIAPALAAEIAYENDETGHWKQTPEERFTRMRAWVAAQVKP